MNLCAFHAVIKDFSQVLQVSFSSIVTFCCSSVLISSLECLKYLVLNVLTSSSCVNLYCFKRDTGQCLCTGLLISTNVKVGPVCLDVY